MARKDREYEQWMAGVIYASNKVVKDGVEELKKDIRKRNLLKVDIRMSERQMQEMYEELSAHVYNNMLVGMLYAIHDCYQFGKVRIKKVKDTFDKLVMDTIDLDYMGQHYVRLEDFAVELNEKYNLGIDISRVVASEESFDARRPDYHYCHVDRVLKELRENGFADAAVFLEKKLD